MSTPYYSDEQVVLHHGDCLDVMRTLPDASVDSVCTDPPYGLEFMGKEWDSFGGPARGMSDETRKSQRDSDEWWAKNYGGYLSGVPAKPRPGAPLAFQRWCELWAIECLRVLKPGGHLLAFGGTRTWHRLACAVEDAGFEIRDSIAWLYGSGFPKSLDVSKAIDKAAGAEREVVGVRADFQAKKGAEIRRGVDNARNFNERHDPGRGGYTDPASVGVLTAPATPDAARWQGWGTALKPAFEPIVVARKPLVGTVAANVLAYGTGALNIDGCREYAPTGNPAGRWPANVVLDDSQADALDAQSGTLHTQKPTNPSTMAASHFGGGSPTTRQNHRDDGAEVGASRFFPTFRYDVCDVCGEDQSGWHRDARDEHAAAHNGKPFPTFRYEAKAPTAERPSYDSEGAGESRVIEGASGKIRQCRVCGNRTIRSGETQPACGHDDFAFVATKERSDRVAHPTVKPLALMRWLVRLVTPPGGTVLEPFAGSGTTAEACVIEGFRCIAIERDAAYLPLITARLTKPIALLLDFTPEGTAC